MEFNALQKARIQVIQTLLPIFGVQYILKGGTALVLYHGLPRFSEDIDLDSQTANMCFLEKLHPVISRILGEYIRKKDMPTVFRAMVDYGAQREGGGAYPLKIEVSSRNVEAI